MVKFCSCIYCSPCWGSEPTWNWKKTQLFCLKYRSYTYCSVTSIISMVWCNWWMNRHTVVSTSTAVYTDCVRLAFHLILCAPKKHQKCFGELQTRGRLYSVSKTTSCPHNWSHRFEYWGEETAWHFSGWVLSKCLVMSLFCSFPCWLNLCKKITKNNLPQINNPLPFHSSQSWHTISACMCCSIITQTVCGYADTCYVVIQTMLVKKKVHSVLKHDQHKKFKTMIFP